MTAPPTSDPLLPDLPDLQIGGDEPVAPGAPSPDRVRRLRSPLQRLWSWLPLVLMVLLAIGSGWLLRFSPGGADSAPAAPLRADPDYTMSGFSITRFDADGQARLRIDGAKLRHYPQTDQLEIEGVHIQATAPDGRRTEARANRALANGDATEVQLIGGAHVTSQLGDGEVLDVRGEFLHAFLRFERLRSHLPVTVQRGRARAEAGGLAYDHLQRHLQFDGPVRLSWPPAGRAPTPAGASRPASAENSP